MLMVLGSAAAAASQVKLDPGLVKADSPIYGLDVAFDNALAMTPLASPGTIAFERASEVVVARNRNNSDAAAEALTQLNRTVRDADSRHEKGLEKAASVLRANLMNGSVPVEETSGVEEAVSRIAEAKNRIPEPFTTEPKPNNHSREFIPDFGG